MNLKEIQRQAEVIGSEDRFPHVVRDIRCLAMLIANLAARMQEIEGQVDANHSGVRYANLQLGKLEQVIDEADVRVKEVEEKALFNRLFKQPGIPVEKFKTHCVTVQYRATIDLNDVIVEAIQKVVPMPNDPENLSYVRITSDRDGV